MDKYVCTKCGYIYDPYEGDPDNDVDGGTSFDDLPKGWVCPECGAKKNKFDPYEEDKEEEYQEDEEF